MVQHYILFEQVTFKAMELTCLFQEDKSKNTGMFAQVLPNSLDYFNVEINGI